MTHPDTKYIQALLENDTVLLKEIYQKFARKIVRLVVKNNGTVKDAQDLLQEALVVIYEQAQNPNFRLTCPFGAYLYYVCRNMWLNELRKRKRQGVTILDTEQSTNIPDDAASLAKETDTRQARTTLFKKMFTHLSEGCQKLLRLSWAGHSMKEVAQMLNITYGYARKRKALCIGKLTQLVKQSEAYHLLKA